MEGLLLEPGSDTNHLPSPVSLLARLHQEVVALRTEVAGLRRPSLELRQQAGYSQASCLNLARTRTTCLRRCRYSHACTRNWLPYALSLHDALPICAFSLERCGNGRPPA